MSTVRIIRTFYIIYSLYTLFVILVSDYNFWYAFVGVGMIWLIYLVFLAGYSSVRQSIESSKSENNEKQQNYPLSNISNWKRITYLVHSILVFICSFAAAKFYTGRNPGEIILGAIHMSNSYAIYQKYAKMANIGVFTIYKIPYVLMLMYCFTMLLWGSVGILLSEEKKNVFQYIFVASSMAALLLFGVARGTNYEMYIVFVTLVYCILNKKRKQNHKFSEKWKKYLVVGIIGVVVILVFKIVVEARGYVFRNQICEEINYDPNKSFSKLFPTITNIGLSFFRYLGWGIFSIGIITDTVVFGSLSSFISSLLPFGYTLIQGESLDSIVRQTISVGTGWVPDYFAFIDGFGWLFFIVLIFVAGKVMGALEKGAYPRLLKSLMGVLIFLEMLSIPVGNFIIVSTPLLLSVLYIAFWFVLHKLPISFVVRKRI